MYNFPIAASFPYFFYFLFLFFIFISPYKKVNSLRLLNFLLFIVLIFTFIFYNGEYSDWRVYREYVNICDGLGCTYFEFGYDFLTYLSSQFIGFPLIPLFSLLLIFIVILKFYKLNEIVYLISLVSILFAFLPLYYGALRQAIAFAFLLFAFLSFYNKDYFKSIFISIIALLFHKSTFVIVVVFLFYYFLFVKLSKKSIFRFSFFLVISFLLGILLLDFAFDYLKTINSFNAGKTMVMTDSTGLKSILLPLERLFILFMSLYIMASMKNSNQFLLLSIIGVCGAMFYLIVYSYSLNTAGRVVAFFRFADLIIIYYFFKIIFNKSNYLQQKNLSRIGMLSIMLYSILKFYFTIISVGFFR